MEREPYYNNTFGIVHNDFSWLNACVGTNGFPDTMTYSEGYLKTPEILINYIYENNKRGEVDLLIYPIAYSARHGIELFLKQILTDISLLRGLKITEKDITKIHSLKKLWDAIKEIAENTDLGLFYLIKKSDEKVSDFYSIDDTAQTFRYPESNVGDTHLLDTPLINLARFLHHFNKLKKELKTLELHVARLKGEFATNTFTDKLSRQQLVKLAYILGNRVDWPGTLTEKKKDFIKSAFKLESQKQLIRAIDTIQSNRYLSSIINVEKPLLYLDKDDILNFKKAWFQIHFKSIMKRKSILSKNYLLDMGTDLSKINSQDMIAYFKLQASTMSKYLPRFTPEKIADINTLIIMGRQPQKYFAEDYESQIKYNINDAKSNTSQEYRHAVDNTAAIYYLRNALKILGCKKLAIQCHLSY